MAVDIKILKLLGEQDKRQRKDRQISSDHMVNSNRILESVNESVRYNISQSNSLKSSLGRLGEVTSKLTKEVNTGKGDSQIDSSKSPTVRKLDEIKLILESQSKLLEKSINSQFESVSFVASDQNAKGKEDKDKEGEGEGEDSDKKSSSLIDSLFKAIAGPSLMASGAALEAAKEFKDAASKAGNTIKNFSNKINGASGKLGNFIKNIGGEALEIGKSLASKVDSIAKGSATSTGKTLKAIPAEKSVLSLASKGDSQIDSSKSPTVRKLDEIKLILKSQNKLLEKSINNQFESDPTKITDLNANDKEDNDKKVKDEDGKDKEPSSLIGSLFKAIAGPALMAAGAALALVVSPFVEPFTRLYDTIKALPGVATKAINGIKSIASIASKVWNSKLFSKVKNFTDDAVKAFKNTITKAGNIIKNFGSKISGAAGKIGNFIKNIGSKALDIGKGLLDKGKSLLDKGKNLLDKGKNLASKAASWGKGVAGKAASWGKGVAGKVGNIVTKIPHVKAAAANAAKVGKGFKAVWRRMPWITAAMESAEAAKIAKMSPEERKKYLGDVVKEMEGKSMLGKAWYAFNNNSKTIAAAGQEASNMVDAFKGIGVRELFGGDSDKTIEMQAKLDRRHAADQEAEKLKAEPIADPDQTEKDKESLKFFKEQNKRLKDPEYMRNLPILPSNTTINQTTVTVPGADYGNTIRRGNK